MKYLSIDVESTGLNVKSNQLIELGIILEDTVEYKPLYQLPFFYCMIDWGSFTGQAYALQMNHRIFKEIAIPTGAVNIYKPHEVINHFILWLNENGIILEENENMYNITAAGKNFQGFDLNFILQLPGFKDKIKFRHRTIDPAILFVDWKKDDVLPSLKECKERSNIEGEITHNALDDAMDIIKILRTKYYPYDDLPF